MPYDLSAENPRPTEVHRKPCRHCPSAHHPQDPESEDQKKFIEAGLLTPREAVFPCGWGPRKLCKGAADYYGLTGPT